MRMKRFQVYLPQTVLEKLEAEAKERDRTVSEVLRAILQRHYEPDSKEVKA